MKRGPIIIFFLFWIPFLVQAQIPEGYYDDARALEGSSLREALHRIIRGHTRRSYAQLWQDFYFTDRKPNDMVWDIYSDIPPPGTPPYEYEFFTNQCVQVGSEGSCYNREHSFPTSWWGGGTSAADTMYTDLFHIHPVDGFVNSLRSNWPYGEVAVPTRVTMNGGRFGPNTYSYDGPSYTGNAFEPIDEYKGDLARNYFYMLTRYMHRIEDWAGNTAMLEGKGFAPWALDMLLKWNDQDPVSQKEVDRNNAIFQIQGNRNPFIDFPEMACMIWGKDCVFPIAILQPTHYPAQPEAFDSISVRAYISHSGNLQSVALLWGDEPENLGNVIPMGGTDQHNKTTLTPIPPRPNASTLHFAIEATSIENRVTRSREYQVIIGETHGGGLETFGRSALPGNQYTDGSFTGNNDIEWVYTQARSQTGYPIEGKGIMLRNRHSSLTAPRIPYGISRFSVEMRKAFTSADPRQLALIINGNEVARSQVFGQFAGESDTIYRFQVNDINIAGDFSLSLVIPSEGDENRQIVIDNLGWQEYHPRFLFSKPAVTGFIGSEIPTADIPYFVVGKQLSGPIVIETYPPFSISADGQYFGRDLVMNHNGDFFMQEILIRYRPSQDGFHQANILHQANQGAITGILPVSGSTSYITSVGDIPDFSGPQMWTRNNRLFFRTGFLIDGPFVLEVFALTGQKLIRQSFAMPVHDGIPLPEGHHVLIVRIHTASGVYTEKIPLF